MVRKLKFHEQKLLKKVDFVAWKSRKDLSEHKILRKYNVKKRSDYTTYNKLSRQIRKLASKISDLGAHELFRTEACARFLEKLYVIGLIPTKWDLLGASDVCASSFCRRRLPVVMVRNKMSENVRCASNLVEQGHVRVGTNQIKDPAHIVSRTLEDYVTWIDTSSIRNHVIEYNDKRDDFFN